MNRMRVEYFGSQPVRFVTDFAGEEWVNLNDLRNAEESS